MKLARLGKVQAADLRRIKTLDDPNTQARARQHKRWLATNHPAWLAMRLRVLAEEPLCRCGCGQISEHVDHINGRADRREDYDRSNLQGMAPACHSKKTALEQAAARQ